jgi:GNAT superfamily N-acetyltransferase
MKPDKLTFDVYDDDYRDQCIKLAVDTFEYDAHPTFSDVDVEKMFDMMIDNELASMYTGTKNRELIAQGAFSIVLLGCGTVSIGNVAVREDQRGKGYGRKMVEYLEEEISGFLSRSNIPICTVFIATFESAVGFWEKLGYTEVLKRPFDRIMTKRLW